MLRRVLAVTVLVGSLLLMGVSGASAASSATHVPAHQGRFSAVGRGNGSFQGTHVIPGAEAKLRSALASGQISEREAEGIPVSVSYVGMAKGFGQGEGGDPTVTAYIYQNNALGMRLWTFEVTQSFDYYNYAVTWLSALSWNGTGVSYPFWSVSNEGSNTSQPATGVWYTETYANAVYNYCPMWVLCSETAYAWAYLDYWGDGYWEWSGDYYNSL